MNIWLILIALSFHFIRYGVIFPLVPLMAERMGAGPAAIGFTVGAFSFIAIFLSIPLGGLVDRLGVKRLLLTGVFCNMVNAAILLRTDTVTELILAQMIAGVAFLLHVVASQAFVSRLPGPLQREKGFGYLSFSAAAGQTLGPVLGGFVVHRFDYQIAFWVVLLLSSTGLVMLGLKTAGKPCPEKDSYSVVENVRQAGKLTSDARILAVLMFTFVIIFTVSLRSSFLPVLLRANGLTEADVGLLLSIFAITSTLIRLFFGKLIEAFDRRMILALAMLAVIVGVSGIPLIVSVVGLAMSLAVFGLGFGLTQPLSMVMISDLTRPDLSGLAMGLRFAVIMLANLLSPILLGLVIDAFGLGSGFYVAAAAVVLTGFYIFGLRPELIPRRRQ